FPAGGRVEKNQLALSRSMIQNCQELSVSGKGRGAPNADRFFQLQHGTLLARARVPQPNLLVLVVSAGAGNQRIAVQIENAPGVVRKRVGNTMALLARRGVVDRPACFVYEGEQLARWGQNSVRVRVWVVGWQIQFSPALQSAGGDVPSTNRAVAA